MTNREVILNTLNEYDVLSSYSFLIKHICFTYNIADVNKQISSKKAMNFIKEVFNIDFLFLDKFIRYIRKYKCVDETKDKFNYKLKISYKQIFELMFMPQYKIMKLKGTKNG